jgi:hypothetical protein
MKMVSGYSWELSASKKFGNMVIAFFANVYYFFIVR